MHDDSDEATEDEYHKAGLDNDCDAGGQMYTVLDAYSKLHVNWVSSSRPKTIPELL